MKKLWIAAAAASLMGVAHAQQIVEIEPAAGEEAPITVDIEALPTDVAAEDIAYEDMTPEQQEAAYREHVAQTMAPMKPTQGQISLNGAPVTLNVPTTYNFYSAADAQTILEDIWGNPPDDTVLGMLFPVGADMGGDNWGVVLTYEESGYVSDKDAAKINFDDLLKEMQQGTRDGNAAREEAGYGSMELVGWAVPPSYDAVQHRMYWAKDLLFSQSDGTHTLNYDMRVLGRGGVLSMNFVAGMNQIADVKAAGPDVLKMAAFNAGQTYADFKPGDKTAGYGIAALIAGGTGAVVAKKAGLFALLLVVLKKFGVFVIAGAAALLGGLGRMFGGKKNAQPPDRE